MVEGLHLRAAALIFDMEGRLLLVRQRWLADGSRFWRPPGGALEPGLRPLSEVAALEAWLETGLQVEVGPMVFVEESPRETGQAIVTAYFLAQVVGGELIAGLDYVNGPLELAVLDGAAFFSQAEVRALDVRPAYLLSGLWDDLAQGFV
jgi:ADP-ribose pyrophosphatase YjhB (NUDIX family)